MAWDAPPEVPVVAGTNGSLYLCGDDDRLREYFARLEEGGQVTMALEPQAWGDEAGALVRRFGVNWMVNISGTGSAPQS